MASPSWGSMEKNMDARRYGPRHVYHSDSTVANWRGRRQELVKKNSCSSADAGIVAPGELLPHVPQLQHRPIPSNHLPPQQRVFRLLEPRVGFDKGPRVAAGFFQEGRVASDVGDA